MKAIIKKPAFFSIITAAVEEFKKECLVVLLGYKKNDTFFIEQGAHFGRVRHRGFAGVKTIGNRYKLVYEIAEHFFKNMQIIGDCHSHPEFGPQQYPPKPSKCDTKNSEKGCVYLIVSINTLKKRQRWKMCRQNTLTGTLGPYQFEMRAYYAPEDETLQLIPLSCPSAYRLNTKIDKQ